MDVACTTGEDKEVVLSQFVELKNFNWAYSDSDVQSAMADNFLMISLAAWLSKLSKGVKVVPVMQTPSGTEAVLKTGPVQSLDP